MAVEPAKRSNRLTFNDAVEVWRMRRSGWLQHHIAARFLVNQGRISEVLAGKLHPGSEQTAKS